MDGVESPFVQFDLGNTYRFNQSDSSNSSHPLLFYLDAAKNNVYSTGVTTNGTLGSSGAYTQIVVSTGTFKDYIINVLLMNIWVVACKNIINRIC